MNELDSIILERIIENVRMQKKRTLSFNLHDIVEMGYSVEEIQESMQRIAQMDARTLFTETKDIPTMPMQ